MPNREPQTFTFLVLFAAQPEFSVRFPPEHWGLRGLIMQKNHDLMEPLSGQSSIST